MFSLILAHTNDYISKEKFVAAGAGLQFAFGLGAMSGPFLCSIFMDVVGPNGYFIFLLLFHGIIGIFGIYRMRVRQTVENPDSQFVAMPQTITPAGIELNPTTEPIEEPIKNENREIYTIYDKKTPISKFDSAGVLDCNYVPCYWDGFSPPQIRSHFRV